MLFTTLTVSAGGGAIASTATTSPSASASSTGPTSSPTSANVPAPSTADTTGPTYLSGTVDKTTLSPSTGNATFTVTVKASDPSGVSTPTVSANSDDTDQSAGFGPMDLVAGTATNGTWKRTITLPATAAPGTWSVSLFPLTDTLGNGNGGFRTITTLTVTDKPPVLAAGSVTISGTAKVGAALSAKTASWPAATKYSYRWSANGVVIAGARSKTYTPTATDLGKKITVRVTGSLPGFTSASRSSTPTSAVTRGTLTAGEPVIVGTAKVGVKLEATAGTWTPGTAFTYQWFVDAKPVSGATGVSFTPKAGHVGKRVTVRVVGSLNGYDESAKLSAPTRPVAK